MIAAQSCPRPVWTRICRIVLFTSKANFGRIKGIWVENNEDVGEILWQIKKSQADCFGRCSNQRLC
jgi:hypothetical protein